MQVIDFTPKNFTPPMLLSSNTNILKDFFG